MSDASRERWNGCRLPSDPSAGHYESWFQRANHPTRPLAFWIRYTIFRPKGRPDAALGELWAIWSDGETGTISAAKEEIPLSRCRFSPDRLDATIGEDSWIREGALEGKAEGAAHAISWKLSYSSPQSPLLLLPEALYTKGFPKAKALVGSPDAVWSGTLHVDGVTHDVEGWVGSQNHNWGSKHTDLYAWGQVAEFDGYPGSFLELATARVKLGPVWTPYLTPIVLRLDHEEYRLNSLQQGVKARGRFVHRHGEPFDWTFESVSPEATIRGRIVAEPTDFVGLTYYNPPGGSKTCLNSKIARCTLTLERPGERPLSVASRCRAAFEILTDAKDHGVPIVA